MPGKILSVGDMPSVLPGLKSILEPLSGPSFLEAADEAAALDLLGEGPSILLLEASGSNDKTIRRIRTLASRSSLLALPVIAVFDASSLAFDPRAFQEAGAAECLPLSLGAAGIADRLMERIRTSEKMQALEAENRGLRSENEKLRNVQFITLEYANMVENDLMDRIKALSRSGTAPPPGAERGAEAEAAPAGGLELEALEAENARCMLEIEKLNVILSTVISHDTILEDNMDERLKRTSEYAYQDPLTGIYNRRKFNEEFVAAYSAMRKGGKPLSLIMFDIDHFKEVNDTFGHDQGDEVLVGIARIVQEIVRSPSVFARWGGEEFMLILPEVDIDGASLLAEKLRLAVRNACMGDMGRVTCSFGAIQVGPNEDPPSILKRIDLSLYQAKEAGRDCVRAGAPNLKRRYSDE